MLAKSSRRFILLFGDSITEQGFGMNGKVGWASLLAADYSRRADVLNRGFFGYNSQHALEHVLPSLPLDGNLLFCTIYFGANDATTPGSRQYIPEHQFTTNLNTMVTTIRSQSRQPKLPIILMVPPPLDREVWANFKGMDNRSNERHKLYGDSVKEVATQQQCGVLDVWTLLEGDQSVDMYGKYLTDGLHLNEMGNRKLYKGLHELLQKEYPNVMPQQDGGDQGVPLEGTLWDELC